MKTLKIKVTENSSQSGNEYHFCADVPAFAGSPPVGYGASKAEAIGNLIINLSKSDTFNLVDGSPLVEVELY